VHCVNVGRVNPGTRRLCLAVDTPDDSRRSIPEQRRAQQGLRRVLDAAWAGLGADRQPNGDGEIALAPPGIDEATALGAVVVRLQEALEKVEQLRLRVAAHAGHVEQGANGFVGHAVVRACRLVGAQALRRALAGHPDDRLALLVSDSLYEDAVSRDDVLHARTFEPVDVTDPAKGFAARAYLHVPGRERGASAPLVRESRFRVDVGPGGRVGSVVQVGEWRGDLRIGLPHTP
jgi:hypothetical protein